MTFRMSTLAHFELLFPYNYKETLDKMNLRYFPSPCFFLFLLVSFYTRKEEREGEKNLLSPYYLGFYNRVGKLLHRGLIISLLDSEVHIVSVNNHSTLLFIAWKQPLTTYD